MSLVDPQKLLEDLQNGKNITRLEHNYICGLLKKEIEMKEMGEWEAIKELAHEGLPDECIRGYTEVKFCYIRNGEGGQCKHCSNFIR